MNSQGIGEFSALSSYTTINNYPHNHKFTLFGSTTRLAYSSATESIVTLFPWFVQQAFNNNNGRKLIEIDFENQLIHMLMLRSQFHVVKSDFKVCLCYSCCVFVFCLVCLFVCIDLFNYSIYLFSYVLFFFF